MAAFFATVALLTGCSYFDVGRPVALEEPLLETEDLTRQPEESPGTFQTPDAGRGSLASPTSVFRSLPQPARTKTRTVSLEEAADILGQMWVPSFLPEGYALRMATLEERTIGFGDLQTRDVTLLYGPGTEWWPWVEIEQPGCMLRPSGEPASLAPPTTERMLGSRLPGEPVIVGGKLGWLLGREETSRTVSLTLGNDCVKAAKDEALGLEAVFRVAEMLRPMRPEPAPGQAAPPFSYLGMLVVPRGNEVVVRAVISATPAERAGVQEGDAVLSVDGEEVHKSEDVTDAIRDRAPGDTVRLKLRRGDQVLEAAVVLEERPVGMGPGWPRPSSESLVGLAVPIDSPEEAVSAVAEDLRSKETPNILFSTVRRGSECPAERFTDALAPWTWWPGEPLPSDGREWQAERLNAGTWLVTLFAQVSLDAWSGSTGAPPRLYGSGIEPLEILPVPVVQRWLVEVESGRVLWPRPYDCPP